MERKEGGKRKMAAGRWKDQKIKIRKRRKERRSVQGKKDEGGKERLRRNEKKIKKKDAKNKLPNKQTITSKLSIN